MADAPGPPPLPPSASLPIVLQQPSARVEPGLRAGPEARPTVKAAFLETTGPPDVLRVGELPTPTPGPGEVLVRIAASAVNPIDLYIRAGTVAMPLPRPFIPGCDLAGTVTALGPHASRFKVGDR